MPQILILLQAQMAITEPLRKYPIKKEVARMPRAPSFWNRGWSKLRRAMPRTAVPRMRKRGKTMEGAIDRGVCAKLPSNMA
jgi:hypothetical protein